jgi:hypothetical protein
LDHTTPDEALEFCSRANNAEALQSYLESRGRSMPRSLSDYMRRLTVLPVKRTPEEPEGLIDATSSDIQLSQGLGKGMTPKKLHEVIC